ncbi:fasciclin domain-containing protein [Akkermansiaceae bacterium]|nr:fasciclin domain-containing protein [Akkermansiaceae bacterium]MDA7502634.1 fasciclin domain-containing protein [bacterium]MDA7531573.1 fasciclin domain-containing protein [Akkermansiaceae bacterium]MDA7536163.1 fasciclin domain-containing protein [bacterium]MDA7615909.1 fasciclin domain-containing protein [Akkermansiaceae bacterium]
MNMITLSKNFNHRELTFLKLQFGSVFLYFLLAICSINQSNAADPAEAKTVGRVIGQRADLSLFLKVLEKTELGSAFSERTDFNNTIFVPNNKAFESLPAGAIETLLDPRNDDRLEEVFNYHAISRAEPAFELEKYRTLQTKSGQWISIDYSKGIIGDAKFTGEVIPCSNGVIYVIDKVLTPTTDDLFQVLQKDGRFTLFTKAITASRQGKLYQNVHDNYTVFAPTDAAFEKLPSAVVSSLFLPENDERLEDIIKHHITAAVFSASPSYGASRLGVADVTPLSAFGQQLNYSGKGVSLTVDGVRISETDIPTANGLIHVVDSVILPAKSSSLEILEKDPRMTNLVKLLEACGLNLALADSSKYTIFAPVNEAWDSEPYKSLLANPSESNREAIFAVLARHVITGKHVSENPVPYEKLRTIHGAPIYLTVVGGKTSIQNVEIIEADLEAFNGLVNVIGKVISDRMELPESDLTRIDAIRFTQRALMDGAKLYDQQKYQESFELFARRGYELVDKYGSRGYFKTQLLSAVALSRDPVREFADNAWDSRNAFRAVLREIELTEDTLGDLLEVNGDPTSKIGR